jgi:hypothetical protein
MVEVATRVRRLPLGALLVKAGVASEADIRDALDEGNRKGEKLGQVVIRRGWLSERKLAKILADQWGVKAPDPAKLKTDPVAMARLDAGLAQELGGLPVAFDEDGLVVAVAEPRSDRFDSLRALLGNVSFVVVPSATLDEMMEERRAIFNNTPSPVELVGAWLAPMADRALDRDSHGRDTDEAPLDDDDNPEQDRSPTMDELYATVEERVEERQDDVQPASYEAVFTATSQPDSVVGHLHSLASEVEALEQELVETRQRAEAQENELAELRRARASDLETISSLGAELEDRRRRLDGLRAVVGELAAEIDK